MRMGRSLQHAPTPRGAHLDCRSVRNRPLKQSTRRRRRILFPIAVLILLLFSGSSGTTPTSATEGRAPGDGTHLLRLNGFEFDPLLGPPPIPARLVHRHVEAADRD